MMKRYRAISCLFGVCILAGCSPSQSSTAPKVVIREPGAQKDSGVISVATDSSDNDDKTGHGHSAGGHGGMVISLGRESYHVEVVFDSVRQIRLYMLGADETRVIDVESQVLKGFLSLGDGTIAKDVEFQPEPQPGDLPNRTSLFVTKLPDDWSLGAQQISCTIPNIAIDGERFRISFQHQPTSVDHASHNAMPSKVANDEESSLYLTPGGRYTQADIEANGNQTASQKFKGIASAHDMNPKAGDRICPITKTKANAQFEWVVDGKKYQFCCPPCVDEFVQMAKQQDKPLEDPDSYVQK